MIVKSASLETTDPSYDFSFQKARAFQNEVLTWLHEGDEQVAVVNAPTGSGKTAAFSELCKVQNKTLLIYPTNSLLTQQKRILENEFGLNVSVLSGETLTEHGYNRTEELLQYATNPQLGDVILTNPDILQANLQDVYVDTAGIATEFFNYFDGIVYDEFHFYDEFEASGLLLQIKVVTDRVPEAKIILSSATPNETLVGSVEEILDVDVARIKSEYVEDGDFFRFDTDVLRRNESLWDSREEIVKILEEESTKLATGQEPRVALVFNSAYYSNRFYSYLSQEKPDLYELTEKDNGYDTHQEEEIEPDKHPILITTKKGEVGLDYDIRTLMMEKPNTAESFLQRFGRAGRKNEATAYLFNLGKLNWWRDKIEYPDFVERIYDSLRTKQSKIDRLTDLTGLRAAHALFSREHQYSEIEEDFADVPNYGKWMKFLINLEEVIEEDSNTLVGGYTNELERLFEFLYECSNVLKGLRGRSLDFQIEYPRGDTSATTSYSLLSAFHHYRIEEVFEDRVKLKPKDPDDRTQIRLTFPGYEKQYRNWEGALPEIERKMMEWIDVKISRADIEKETDLSEGFIKRFLSLVKITRSALPVEIAYGKYRFEVKQTSLVPEVIPKDA